MTAAQRAMAEVAKNKAIIDFRDKGVCDNRYEYGTLEHNAYEVGKSVAIREKLKGVKDE